MIEPDGALDRLRRDLLDRRLVSPGDLSVAEACSASPPTTARDLARALVECGKITPFQAECLVGDRADRVAFGEYVVLRPHRSGGMGRVYLARHRHSGDHVAIKTLPPATDRISARADRFRREVWVGSRLTHPNVVALLDAGEEAGIPYLVMEFVAGSDLSDLVTQRGGLGVGEAVGYVCQAARGLGHAHRHGIIHRDVKPSNLLVDADGTVKVLDLGLAQIKSRQDGLTVEQLTESGALLGTPEYMAPEQSGGDVSVGIRSDIYSLGCTLHHLLLGRPPYQGRSAIDRALAHSREPIPQLRSLRPDVPECLDDAFRRMIAKRAEDRFGSMDEVLEALSGIVEEATPPAATGALGRGRSAIGSGDTRGGFDPRTPPDDELGRTRPTPPPAVTPAGPTPRGAASGRPSRRLTLRRGIVLGLSGCLVAGGLAVWATTHPPGLLTARKPPGDLDRFDADISRAARPEGKANAPIEATTPDPPTGEGLRPDPPRPPELLVSPFTPDEAATARTAWARSLDRPERIDLAPGQDLILIPPGEFEMGSDDPSSEADERPLHRVRITRPFYMSTAETTVGQFRRFVEATGYRTTAEIDGQGGFGIDQGSGRMTRRAEHTWRSPGFAQSDDDPVTGVSHDDCEAYCGWLRGVAEDGTLPGGWTVTLPTEAQWEYACRAGTTTAYFHGDDEEGLPAVANILDGTAYRSGRLPSSSLTSAPRTATSSRHRPAGSSPTPSASTTCTATSSEWCADWYDPEFYAGAPLDDPAGPPAGTKRISRGGSWIGKFPDATASRRFGSPPTDRDFNRGFRVVAVPVSR